MYFVLPHNLEAWMCEQTEADLERPWWVVECCLFGTGNHRTCRFWPSTIVECCAVVPLLPSLKLVTHTSSSVTLFCSELSPIWQKIRDFQLQYTNLLDHKTYLTLFNQDDQLLVTGIHHHWKDRSSILLHVHLTQHNIRACHFCSGAIPGTWFAICHRYNTSYVRQRLCTDLQMHPPNVQVIFWCHA